MNTDGNIIELYFRRDERALMEATSKYEAYCQRIAYAILKDESAARECFREALYVSWQTIPPERPKSLRIFLVKLVRKNALMFREEKLQEETADVPSAVINEYLASLPEKERRIFVKRYWFVLSEKSIASSCGMTEEQVAVSLAVTRDGLKRALNKTEETWTVDRMPDLIQWVDGIDERFVAEADDVKEAAPVAKISVMKRQMEREALPRSEARAKKGIDPAKRKKILRFACIAAGALSVVLLVWFLLRPQKILFEAEIDIDEKHFPDMKFREYVKDEFDHDKDGKLNLKERQDVFTISVSGSYGQLSSWSDAETISSLQGIEYFPNLEELRCEQNELTTLDLKANKALEQLDCHGNKLTTLILGSNKTLETIDCYDNELTGLDVSGLRALERLDCHGNRLEALDVSKNEALETLDCSSNAISDLKIGENKQLETLWCYDCDLEELDVHRAASLTKLVCYNNRLTKLDLHANTALETISCMQNRLTELDVSANTVLRWLDCSNNALASLNVGENSALEVLGCNNNQFASLDLSTAGALTALSCEGNPLASLSLKDIMKLEYYYPGENPPKIQK